MMVEGDPSEPEMTPADAIDEDIEVQTLVPDIRGTSGTDRDEDPIWTWNAPDYITGDSYGIRPEGSIKPSKNAQSHEQMLADKMSARPARIGGKRPLKGKLVVRSPAFLLG
jgi:hypothetical protein